MKAASPQKNTASPPCTRSRSLHSSLVQPCVALSPSSTPSACWVINCPALVRIAESRAGFKWRSILLGRRLVWECGHDELWAGELAPLLLPALTQRTCALITAGLAGITTPDLLCFLYTALGRWQEALCPRYLQPCMQMLSARVSE